MSTRTSIRPRLSTVLAALGLISLLALPALGSQLYFRHDDASFILFAARFHGSWLGVFSTDPGVNTWGTLSGMSAYYRPTAYLLALALVRTIGPHAAVLMALAGAAMSAALALFYVTSRIIAGSWRSVIALYLALAFGNSLLYQSFRLMVPWGYLLIMAALACLLLGARRRSTTLVLLGGALWLLSSFRQSAVLLVPAVILVALITVPVLTSSWPSRAAAVKRFALLLGPFAVGAAALTIVDSLRRGSSGASVGLAHVAERYWFYAETVLGGPRALLLVPPVYYLIVTYRGRTSDGASAPVGLRWLPLVLSLSAAVAVAFMPALGPAALVAAGVLGGRRMHELWVGTTWFVVGFLVYLVPEYYHQAYILEAFLGLALVVACCTPLMARQACVTMRSLLTPGRPARGLLIVAASVLLVSVVLVGAVKGPGLLSSARSALTGLVNANRAFGESVAYLASLPHGKATVLAYSNEQRGLSNEAWRERGLAYRATVVPVMDQSELRDMLEAIRAPGIAVEQFAEPDGTRVRQGEPLYGIAYSEAEREAMAESWLVTPVAHFTRGNSTYVILRLRAPPR